MKLRPSVLHLSFQYWLKQLVFNLFCLLWSTWGVCWSQHTRTGWFRYLPPNTCNDLFFFSVFPSQSHHLYHQFNIRVLVLNLINRYEVQTTYSIEQEIYNFILYKTQVNFYFETHLFPRGGENLNSISFIIFCLLVWPWRVPWKLTFKHSSMWITTETPSAPIHMTPTNMLVYSWFQEHLEHRNFPEFIHGSHFLRYPT